MSQDIPTFDGTEFLGGKPKSDEINKIMEMLRIPQEKRAGIQNEKNELKAPSKESPAKKILSKSDQQMPNQLSNMVRERSPSIVKAPHLNAEEKKLVNKFSQLFREMKQTGKDHRGKLFVLLDGLRDNGLIDEADYDKA